MIDSNHDPRFLFEYSIIDTPLFAISEIELNMAFISEFLFKYIAEFTEEYIRNLTICSFSDYYKADGFVPCEQDSIVTGNRGWDFLWQCLHGGKYFVSISSIF